MFQVLEISRQHLLFQTVILPKADWVPLTLLNYNVLGSPGTVHWPKTSLHTTHFETFLFTLLPKCPEAPGAICSKGGLSYP